MAMTEEERRRFEETRRGLHQEPDHKPTFKEKVTRFVKGTPEGKAKQEQKMRQAQQKAKEFAAHAGRAAGSVATGAHKLTREEIRRRYVDYERGRVQRLKKSGKRWSPGYQRKTQKSRNPTTMQSFGMDMNVFEPDRENRPERMHEPKSGLVNILADHSSGGMLENGGMGSDRKQKKSFLESW